MPKTIQPQRGLFLCLALAVGILGCQPTPTEVTGDLDSSTAPRRSPTPKASVSPDPNESIDPNQSPTPAPTPTPTPNPLGILRVEFGPADLTEAEGASIQGQPTLTNVLYLKPSLQRNWPANFLYDKLVNGSYVKEFYPSVVKKAYLAKVLMSTSNPPGDTELTLTLPNQTSHVLAAGNTYTLGAAPFADLTGCPELNGITITTAVAKENYGNTVRDNGIRFLINSREATSDLSVRYQLQFKADSVLARTNGATDIEPVITKVTVTNTGDFPVTIN